jgi:hypothetical protein
MDRLTIQNTDRLREAIRELSILRELEDRYIIQFDTQSDSTMYFDLFRIPRKVKDTNEWVYTIECTTTKYIRNNKSKEGLVMDIKASQLRDVKLFGKIIEGFSNKISH